MKEPIARYFVSILILVLLGCKKDETEIEVKDSSDQSAIQAKRSRQEIVSEIYRVVLKGSTLSKQDFVQSVSNLEQGGSLEGLYNGIVYSAKYRELEKSSSASPSQLRLFCEMINRAHLQLGHQRQILRADSVSFENEKKPLVDPKNSFQFSKVTEEDKPPRADVNVLSILECESQFVGSSIFTLARIASEEILNLLGEQGSLKQKRSRLYSDWVIFLNQQSNIDFGLAERSNPDLGFHFDWAEKSTLDQITWELLNRIHRVLKN